MVVSARQGAWTTGLLALVILSFSGGSCPYFAIM